MKILFPEYVLSFLLVFLFSFFKTVSVSVSVLTLSCIAQDRWYAICHPLMFKSTAKRARKSIVVIWVVSCVIMIPQAIVMECSSLLPELTNKTSLFTVCDEHWGGQFSTMDKKCCSFPQNITFAISKGYNTEVNISHYVSKNKHLMPFSRCLILKLWPCDSVTTVHRVDKKNKK